ncbi:MAG TPA: ABC transporter ATP-binding protein/permease [Paenalcaligenes sp.]|nr:ABC transporter ATP-binding protein/permease [Paenalcaligenes sp.]
MNSTNRASTLSRNDALRALRSILPYVWQYKWRVIIAMLCLIGAKVASVVMPLFLKDIIDDLSLPPSAIVLPIAALIGYGFSRLLSGVLGEIRDAIFAPVTQGSIRRIATQVFQHLFALSLRFHINRQTGGLSRDIERGTRGISFLLNFTLFNVLPTLLEIVLVATILLWRFEVQFALVTLATITAYIVFTLVITEKRMRLRRQMNELDSQANTRAIDALLNYETVKYFGCEEYEYRRYDENLGRWVKAAIRNQVSLNLLNMGQAVIITLGVTSLLWMSAAGVVDQRLSVGDVVLVSAYLTQLYAPLNFLGFVYREIRHALTDMERMFSLLEQNQEVKDAPSAHVLESGVFHVAFQNVGFAYDERRPVIRNLSFEIPAGHTLAVVGPSGAGKSTLARLLYRFYDVEQGAICIDGTDIRNFTQDSLRRHIGIVPQDTVLFNDTIYHNIAYAKPEATREEVLNAAKSARIHQFIEQLPDGYDTIVGERGLKLSGGEKQRVAIARTLLKNPPILILDEATSALDTPTERAIQEQLKLIAAERTTLIIAHRLSTVVDADQIMVLDEGEVVEQGTHLSLLQAQGVYAAMWALQQQEQE